MSSAPDENLLLYLNLTGECFYIVAHRMRSQGIDPGLQNTVFNQLVLAICSPEVINDLKAGHLPITRKPFDLMLELMREIIDATIMKMNEYSMEKLFELTLIATKYQFSVCSHAEEVLLIVLNHLDTLRKYATEERAVELGEELHRVLVESYGDKTPAQMLVYRETILRYLQGMRLKMTNLVNLGYQDQNGDFIRPQGGAEFGDVLSGGKQLRDEVYSLALDGDRGSTLGLSIYDQPLRGPVKAKKKQKSKAEGTVQAIVNQSASAPPLNSDDSISAVQELDFCSSLLGGNDSKEVGKIKKIFTSEPKDEEPVLGAAGSTINSSLTVRIDGRMNRADELAFIEIAKDFEPPPSTNDPEAHRRSSISDLMETLLVGDEG